MYILASEVYINLFMKRAVSKEDAAKARKYFCEVLDTKQAYLRSLPEPTGLDKAYIQSQITDAQRIIKNMCVRIDLIDANKSNLV